MLESFLQDIRIGFRVLLKEKSFCFLAACDLNKDIFERERENLDSNTGPPPERFQMFRVEMLRHTAGDRARDRAALRPRNIELRRHRFSGENDLHTPESGLDFINRPIQYEAAAVQHSDPFSNSLQVSDVMSREKDGCVGSSVENSHNFVDQIPA